MITVKRSVQSSIRDFPGEKMVFSDFTILIGTEQYEQWVKLWPIYGVGQENTASEDWRRLLEEVIDAGIEHLVEEYGGRA